jgi:hypothetical protein
MEFVEKRQGKLHIPPKLAVTEKKSTSKMATTIAAIGRLIKW